MGADGTVATDGAGAAAASGVPKGVAAGFAVGEVTGSVDAVDAVDADEGAGGVVGSGAAASIAVLGFALLPASCSSGVPFSNCHKSKADSPITAMLARALMLQKLSFAATLLVI